MPDGANHVAFAYSKDGKDRFTTVYPNLNLLDGTKDFSGVWGFASNWANDGTYKGLTVKKRTGQWDGINKTFTAPKDGKYTFSAYVKSSGNNANVFRYVLVNGGDRESLRKGFDNNFDWARDSITFDLKANDKVSARYEISGSGTDSILWTAGHKLEEGSTATPWVPSLSEATAEDYPSYIGTYTDNESTEQSTSPEKYIWKKKNK
ncbi:tail protein [Lactococcus phage phi7]|uniref:Uncharacterized protein n=1 Tax=Lactococcus phage phi7 TaxID=1262538 RepID=R9R1J7_9CAUD|nr:tail protein [Lactococcus phage phi7]AGI11192.1 hypothetical protein phi7_0013 [Lactococcus phage phi7]